MLKDDFFTIKSVSPETSHQYRIEIELNPGHPIYQGHFPGMPVVPGVCQIGIVKEVLEGVLKKSFNLSAAKNIKFTHPIDPRQIKSLVLELAFEEKKDGVLAKATLYAMDKVCLKFNGLFIEESHQGRSPDQ